VRSLEERSKESKPRETKPRKGWKGELQGYVKGEGKKRRITQSLMTTKQEVKAQSTNGRGESDNGNVATAVTQDCEKP
jgi:hypothetical protein